MKKQTPENKSAAPTLKERNAEADKEQEQGAKLAARGKPATLEELAQSGYRLPEGFLEQVDVNAEHPSSEQRAGDGGSDSPAKE